MVVVLRAFRFLAVLIAVGFIGRLTHCQEIPDKVFVPDNRWALVIGAANYSDQMGKLRYPARDARDFAAELTGPFDFQPENVRLIADGGDAKESATSSHILGALDSLLADPRLDKANLFVFYFSGHGAGKASGDYLLPSDVEPDRVEQMGVPVKSVIARIVNAGLRNVLVIADACRSGEANPFGRELSDLCRKANIAVMLGCSPGKRSYEYPALKSGVFTHFLIQDLNKRELQDTSGSVWASRVGQEVQKDVHDYTEPDYGKYAQTPSLWAEQTTLDVLLAAHPKPPVTDIALQAFHKMADKLNQAELGAAMTAYACELLWDNRTDQCIELLKNVDQLGVLTPAGRYILGEALGLMGRTGEAQRALQPLLSMPVGDYFRDLALTSSISRSVSPVLRLGAAHRLLSMHSDWAHSLRGWLIVEALGGPEERLHWARVFAAIPGQPDRKRYFGLGVLADVEGRPAESIAEFDKALKSPGQWPQAKLIVLFLLRPTELLNDPAAMEGFLTRSAKLDDCAAVCYLKKAAIAKSLGDFKTTMASLKEALKAKPDPAQLLDIARLAGFRVSEIRPELTSACESNPYCWQARLALAFLKEVLGDWPGSTRDVNVAQLYEDDRLTFDSKQFELGDNYFYEAVLEGKLKESTYHRLIDTYFLNLTAEAKDFGYDPDLWTQLLKYGLVNERTAQVSVIASKLIPFTPESAPRSLRSTLLLLWMNLGNTAMIERLHKTKFEVADETDMNWLYAAYVATRGREAEAMKLIEHLGSPSPTLVRRMETLRTYLLAATGHRAEAKKRLATKDFEAIARGFDALAWAALGDWKRAEPLLLEQANAFNWAAIFLNECAVRILERHYRQTNRIAAARSVAWKSGSSQPGNPLFDKLTMAAKPGIAQFAGKVQLDAVMENDILSLRSLASEGKPTYAPCKMTFTVTPQGDLTGALTDDIGGVLPFKGKVDAFGNLRGGADWSGRHLTLVAKIAPPPLYKTDPSIRSDGEILQFIDAKGFRIAVVGFVDMPKAARIGAGSKGG